jgi:isopentenyldiphosphate isomerase
MLEYFDILDAQGNQTGLKKLRLDVHRDGDWHRSVHIWIVNPKGEVLLQKRAQTKDTAPGSWDISCAGHISAGDDAKVTAVREIGEELGVPIDPNGLNYLFTIKRQMDHSIQSLIDNEFNEVFLYVIDADATAFTPDLTETEEFAFVPYTLIETKMDSSDPRFVLYNGDYREKLYSAFKNYFEGK